MSHDVGSVLNDLIEIRVAVAHAIPGFAPRPSGSAAGALHRGWISVREGLTDGRGMAVMPALGLTS